MARLNFTNTYLVFAKKGEVKDDFERFGVGSEDDEVSHATV